jgi:hypothetical protein
MRPARVCCIQTVMQAREGMPARSARSASMPVSTVPWALTTHGVISVDRRSAARRRLTWSPGARADVESRVCVVCVCSPVLLLLCSACSPLVWDALGEKLASSPAGGAGVPIG